MSLPPAKKKNRNRTWKKAERQGARYFGAERNLATGRLRRGEGRQDSDHPRLWIEAKYLAVMTIRTLWETTRAKTKLPVVLMLKQKRRHGQLVVVHSADFTAVALEWARAHPETWAALLAVVAPQPAGGTSDAEAVALDAPGAAAGPRLSPEGPG